jgi:hypothetical protein
MKPLPDLSDDAAMAARGRRSALMAARKDALDELRDIYTRLQACAPELMADYLRLIQLPIRRLHELEAMLKDIEVQA